MLRRKHLPAILLIALLLVSCSNPRADYEEVQKLQDAAEQVLQRSPDYDVRIKSCDDAISALQRFLDKHKEGEWTDVARNALASWQARKSNFEREINSLMEQLSSQLRERAIEEAKKVHPASNIENLNLENRARRKEGYNILLNDTYSIRMRGAILGTHIFKLTVRVSGSIAMDSKKIFVDENARVEE